MAGIAILLDLWKKNQSFNPGLCSARTYQSTEFFSASAAAATASVAAGTSFASRALFGSQVAYCDAGVVLPGNYIFDIQSASSNALQYSTKQYNVQLKPLFSAFELRAFAMTSLRSFLMFYLPLLETRAQMEDNDDDDDDDDDNDFLVDREEERRVDLVAPFKKSVKQIIRETSVVTTRRILERISVLFISQRMAWKILKDAPKSAVRKAGRQMPTLVYIYRVSRTTFRGHMLGVAASWLVQVGIELYRFLVREDNSVDKSKQVGLVRQKVFVATVRCSSSLIFASVGAGIGATLIRPSVGQWIGCAAGDFAGPIIVALCADAVFHVKL